MPSESENALEALLGTGRLEISPISNFDAEVQGRPSPRNPCSEAERERRFAELREVSIVERKVRVPVARAQRYR